MGRRIPIGNDDPILVHTSVLSLSLFIIGMASTMVIITGLCGVLFGRKSPPEQSSSPTSSTDDKKDATSNGETDDNDLEDAETRELPLPPALKAMSMKMPRSMSTNNLAKSHSTRNFDKAISMKMPRSMSTKLQDDKHHRKKGKLNSENSLWAKPIILGEKCKVPDEEDTLIYDKKGNKITTYHKKTTSSMSMSRQSSYIDPIAIPIRDKDKGVRKGDDEDSSNGDK
ncbi:hypothetical protein ACFE04_012023 [Oxalis oulophora]